MIMLSWNCQGLRNLWTVHEFCRMVREKKPNLVFLMETKLRKNKMEVIWMKIGFKNLFVVESVEKSRGLGLFWEDGS
jgi:exonuclease III